MNERSPLSNSRTLTQYQIYAVSTLLTLAHDGNHAFVLAHIQRETVPKENLPIVTLLISQPHQQIPRYILE